MYLEIELQYPSWDWLIDQLKCHKIGANEKINCKQVMNKVPFLFLDFGMHKLR